MDARADSAATGRTQVCASCGATNPAGATFCQVCRGFLGWDQTTSIPQVRTDQPPESENEASIQTRVIPKITDGAQPPRTVPADRAPAPLDRAPTEQVAEPAPVDPSSVLTVRLDSNQVMVPLNGDRIELSLMITNRSQIVDGYEVDVGGAPVWLKIVSEPLRLLPGSEGALVVGLRVESENLVPAGQGTVRLRIRSQAQPPAHQIIPITVTVPVVDAAVRLGAEPRVLRLQDVEVGRFVVVVDNSDANRAATVHLSGSDPELAVDFHFDPVVVTVGPGQTARVRAVTTSQRPRPGTELTRTVTVAATEGKRRVETIVTLLQATSAVVEDPMVELVALPAQLRLQDGQTATSRLRVDNSAGRQWATIRVSASDPEQVVDVQWAQTELRVAPGQSTDVDLRVATPIPEPGSEARYSVTLSATDGRRTARTELTVVHNASASPMTTLGVRLDPSVLRLEGRRRGASAVVIDNRAGRLPAQVRLNGDDPENLVGFTFTPPELTVGPGLQATSRVSVVAPRAASGRETTRPITVSASDGWTSVAASGSIIQTAADRRPWARVVMTLIGALAMVLGTMLPLLDASDTTAFGVNVDTVARLFNRSVNLGGFEQLITFGAVILVLAGLLVFGLTGQRGRLSRLVALLTVLLTVGLLVTVGLANFDATPGSGSLLIIAGGVLGYIGGLLTRR